MSGLPVQVSSSWIPKTDIKLSCGSEADKKTCTDSRLKFLGVDGNMLQFKMPLNENFGFKFDAFSGAVFNMDGRQVKDNHGNQAVLSEKDLKYIKDIATKSGAKLPEPPSVPTEE